MKVAALWSGGKDSCLAAYEASTQGYEIATLLDFIYLDDKEEKPKSISNILSSVYNRVGRASPRIFSKLPNFAYKDVSRMVPHEVSPVIISAQARAMDIPLVQKEVSWSTFATHLQSTLHDLKLAGIDGLVFGVVPPHYPIDSDEKRREYRTLMAHKDWMNHVCKEAGLKPLTPLWEKKPEQILTELVNKDFETIIVVVDTKLLGEEWLGRKIDHDFINEVRKLNREKSVHVGGSGYHTLITDSPLFKKRLNIVQSKTARRDGYCILEIEKIRLEKKTKNTPHVA